MGAGRRRPGRLSRSLAAAPVGRREAARGDRRECWRCGPRRLALEDEPTANLDPGTGKAAVFNPTGAAGPRAGRSPSCWAATQETGARRPLTSERVVGAPRGRHRAG